MVHLLQRFALIGTACATCIALNGCLINGISGGTVNGITTVTATATLQRAPPCVVDVPTQTTTCTSTMTVSLPNGTSQSFPFVIKLLGFAAPFTLFDPLIVQVPASMSDFAGSIAVGPPGVAPDTPLSIISGLTSVPIDAHTSLVAEPGMQLVIIDFQAPETAPLGQYTLKLQFRGTATSIKVVFAGKVTAGATMVDAQSFDLQAAQVYYVPIYPCVTDFANVLPIPVPLVNLASLVPIILSAQGCNGKVYSFPGGAPVNYQGLWWNAPASSESGWGINFAHQGDVIFASWFTYDLNGKGWWLVMTAPNTGGNTFSGSLLTVTGPAFDAVPFDPSQVVGTVVGTGTLNFTDANNGTFAYTVNGISQTKNITREVFGPLPTCVFGAQPNLALATNYQDLWWKTPAASESGWGINFTHQGDAIFATWFTYDHDHTPMWLVVTANKSAPGIYTGTLYRTTGPAFNAVPFNPAAVVGTNVGTATLTFTDGNTASFAYTVNGVSQVKTISREIFRPPGTVCQ
jgi:hypothetical protein